MIADNATLHGVQNAIGGSGDDIFKTNTSVSNSFDGIAGSDTVDYSTLTASQNINVTLAGTSASTVILQTLKVIL